MTLDRAFAVYTGEPYCLRPWEIARLTDWQLEFLYRRPMERDARRAKGLPPENPEWSGGGQSDGDDSMPRDREQFVRWWRRVNGGSREEALKRFEQEFGRG